jgi:hypothetical protein
MHTAEPLLPEPSSLKVNIAIEKQKRYESPAIEQILTELIQAGGNASHYEICKLTKANWNKEEFPLQ